MEATKRPWTVEGPKHEHYHASIMGADGHLIVNIGDGGNGRDVQLANADLIVRAVNTFDQAREALKGISSEVAMMLGLQEEELRDLFGHANVGCLKERLGQAKAALDAMEGQP